MQKGSSTSWTISLEDARPRLLNEKSIEKESVQKIQKYDKKKSRKKETSQKVKVFKNCERSLKSRRLENARSFIKSKALQKLVS